MKLRIPAPEGDARDRLLNGFGRLGYPVYVIGENRYGRLGSDYFIIVELPDGCLMGEAKQ